MPRSNTAPNIELLFDDIRFPATKPEIIEHAKEQKAGEEAFNILNSLPHTEYETLVELNDDLSLIEKQPGSQNLWSSKSSDSLPHEEDKEIVETIKGKGKV